MPAFFRNERRPVSSEEVAALAPRVAFLGSFFLDMAFSCFTRIYDSEPPPKRPRRSSPKPQLQRRSHDRRLRSGKPNRSEEHTSELQSLMRISYAVFCLKKKIRTTTTNDQLALTHQIK